MINLLVPSKKEGGVYDFACKQQELFGQFAARLVHLAKDNASDWTVEPGDTVVLQYSGYGFQQRGAPLWLLHEIEKRRKHIKTFGVFFHELYAFGSPWTSSFWLSPVQRHIARRLAILSDFWMTNRKGYALWLRRSASNKPHAILPVFSNIGELDTLNKSRLAKIIVFGSAELRKATYQAIGEKLFVWAKQASLEIHDIGATVTDRRLLETLHANGIVLHGHLNEQEISRLMQEAQFGLLAYPAEYLAKSSVFAAYSAHGICPVLISENYCHADGLMAGVHYLPGLPDAMTYDTSSISQMAWSWYQSHRLVRHIDSIKLLIKRF